MEGDLTLPVYILSGGMSSRFGRDKARALLDREPLLARVARILHPVASSLTVVADREGKYEDLGFRTIADAVSGQGPSRGLLTAITDLVSDIPSKEVGHDGGWFLLCACDLVEIDAAWVATLAGGRGSGSRAVAFKGEYWEPLFGLYHVSLEEPLRGFLGEGERVIWRFLERAGATSLPLPGGRMGLGQVNTQADLEAWSD